MGRVICESGDWDAFSTASHERYDAWVHKLNDTFGSWNAAPYRDKDFSAKVQTNTFGSFRVIDCICDPCAGERTSSNIGRDDEELVAIQLVVYGTEKILLGDEEYSLGAGDIIVWDNTQRMKFEVQEKLHKVSAILPLQRLKDWMPTSWKAMPRKIAAGTPHNAVLNSFLMPLSRTDFDGSRMNDDALSEAAVAMLANSAANLSDFGETSVRSRQLRLIKTHIDHRLKDADLTLETIAKSNGISLRYLHRLFSETGETVSQYVMARRLDRCRQDLCHPLMSRSITELAHSWGFSDAAHFSKRFKMAYGSSPTDYKLRNSKIASPTGRLSQASN